MSHAVKRLLIIGCMLLCWSGPAPAQAPSSEAMTAARELVTTLKFPERYKALLPAIFLSIKPALTQERAEIERDYDAMTATVAKPVMPFTLAKIGVLAL